MSKATELRRAVKARFFPFVEQREFMRAKSTHPLFTVFRRRRGATVQVFDVQWDKYHRPYFVINFGEAPVDGLEFAGSRIAPDAIEPAHCRAKGRLQRARGGPMSCWFHPRKPLREAVTTLRLRYSPEQVVDQAILAFAELEEWWATKAEGPHVYIRRT